MQAVFSILAGIVALPSMSSATIIGAAIFGQLIASLVIDHFGWFNVPVSMLGEEPRRISSHQARPHATGARPARSPTRRAAGASVRIAGPGARPPSLRASPIHVLRRPSGGTYLRCGRVSRASCSTVVLISLTAGG